MAKKTCPDCGVPCSGSKCRKCFVLKSRKHNPPRCKKCDKALDTCRLGVTGLCKYCFNHTVVQDESRLAPSLPPIPNDSEVECVVLTDLHIPYHDPTVVTKACETAQLLGISRLVIAGDLLHADVLSRFDSLGPAPSAYEELESAGRICRALLSIFNRITIIPGNHDQRWEKAFSRLKGAEAQAAMDVIQGLTGAEDSTPGALALGALRRALDSDKITVHPLPEMVVGQDPGWRIMHPGVCSRTAGSTERKMAGKHLQHVLGGHNHLAGYQIHESGKFIAGNLGHACDHSKFRYVREKPTSFPMTVPGHCAIITDKDAPGGRLIPLIQHEAWMDLGHLAARLEKVRGP